MDFRMGFRDCGYECSNRQQMATQEPLSAIPEGGQIPDPDSTITDLLGSGFAPGSLLREFP